MLSEAEQHFINHVQGLREKLLEDDIPVSSFNVRLEISGRVATGEMKYTAQVTPTIEGVCESVIGRDIHNAFTEAMRRCGYEKANNAICLPRGKVEFIQQAHTAPVDAGEIQHGESDELDADQLDIDTLTNEETEQ